MGIKQGKKKSERTQRKQNIKGGKKRSEQKEGKKKKKD